jgi:OFA family oxalate/formate antiporter-like MFS transporter
VVVCGLSFMVVNPPTGYVPADMVPRATKKPAKVYPDAGAAEMLKNYRFYVLWLIYFVGAGAGLMVIGSVAGLAKQSLGDLAFVAVAIMALGNAGGRIIAGTLSDKIGRRATLFIMLALQAVMMFAAMPVIGTKSPVLLVVLATFIGFNYGSNLALFPSFSKDYWGLKNYGLNYGMLFTAWGVGGMVMGKVSEMLVSRPGGQSLSFMLAGGLCLLAAALTILLGEAKAEESCSDLKAVAVED